MEKIKDFKGILSDSQKAFVAKIINNGFSPRVSGSAMKTLTFWKDGVKYGYINVAIIQPKIVGYTFKSVDFPDYKIRGNGQDPSPFRNCDLTKKWFNENYGCCDDDYIIYTTKGEYYIYITNIMLAYKVFNN